MELAVKLNQSFESLYELDFLEYSIILSILKRKIEESNTDGISSVTSNEVYFDSSKPIDLNLPKHLKIK